ncbi:regulator of G protein signaling domain protein [Teladorsagia circumcincta]|uniref:Regulator of G protein signaling domain protein n=1 Tax=Teladorsagia circumcincta TaxID=45464 RepID=A0A2G9U7I3_TELCI|nr:regulator of G protein signaling domain protein [Teladorsagia circumcincta]
MADSAASGCQKPYVVQPTTTKLSYSGTSHWDILAFSLPKPVSFTQKCGKGASMVDCCDHRCAVAARKPLAKEFQPFLLVRICLILLKWAKAARFVARTSLAINGFGALTAAAQPTARGAAGCRAEHCVGGRELLLLLVLSQPASPLSEPGRLDTLSRRLQESVQLRTHKYFRVAVPQALTGQSLVALVGEKGYAEDEAEAVHLATLLLQHGYLFPVIEPALTVRDDGTLYRLQRPYFWPSHATQTDNVEYAIYLNKRLLRNEQKHGLEEDEAESYNRFAELLGHMWGFITQQAEMQLKHQKEKKKADKVVYDSEERAFWRLRRPSHPDFLEQHVQKDLKYSPNEQIDQKTERIYEEFLAPGAPAQVNVDSRTLDQTLDCLQKATTASTRRHAFTHSEEHVFTLMAKDSYPRFVRSQIYKGVLSAAQQQGSRRLGWRNFIFNMGAAKKNPQCKPTKRDELHSTNLPKQLSSDSLPVLETFLESEFSSENIRFWIAIQDLKYSPNEQIDQKTERIYEEFLAPGAPAQVNVDSRTLDQTLDCLQKATTASTRRHAFTHSEEHVFTLMAKDSYPRFVRSQIYKTGNIG